MPALVLIVFAAFAAAPRALAQPAALTAELQRHARAAQTAGVPGVEVTWQDQPEWARLYPALGIQHRYGSTVGASALVPIQIVFDSSTETLARSLLSRYDAETAQFYAVDGGVGRFPGAVYDVSDPDRPRRLNIGFLEQGEALGHWGFASSEHDYLEHLYVWNSDYDGTGAAYAGVTLGQGVETDLLYEVTMRLAEGRTLLETDPARVDIALHRIAILEAVAVDEGAVLVHWSYVAEVAAAGYRLYTTEPAGQEVLLAELPLAATSYRHAAAARDGRRYRLEVVDAEGHALESSGAISVTIPEAEALRLLARFAPQGDAYYKDIWGYVDAAKGREYALLASPIGLSVIDLDAETPVEVGFAPIREAFDVKTYGHYAYVNYNTRNAATVVDLSDPTAPRIVREMEPPPQDVFLFSHNLLIEGQTLYVLGGGTVVYDLADPEDPAFIASYPSLIYHDLHARGTLGFGMDSRPNGGVDVLDLSDPAHIEVITRFTYPNPGAHNACLTEDGAYLVVGDETGLTPWNRVFDVRDLDNIELVAEIVVNPDVPTHNCHIRRGLLYIAHYAEGVRVFDLSDPTQPRQAAYYASFEEGTGFTGAWTAYPYLPSGRLIVGSTAYGLSVFEVEDGLVRGSPAPDVPAFAFGGLAPNPSRGQATAHFTLGRAVEVRVDAYDVLGRAVGVWAEGRYPAGPHAVALDAAGLAPGVYFVRLTAGGYTATRSLTLLR